VLCPPSNLFVLVTKEASYSLLVLRAASAIRPYFEKYRTAMAAEKTTGVPDDVFFGPIPYHAYLVAAGALRETEGSAESSRVRAFALPAWASRLAPGPWRLDALSKPPLDARRKLRSAIRQPGVANLR
jgi:hypothetical protein